MYWHAIRALPEKYVHEETQLTTITSDTAVACNPEYTPMVYRYKHGWKEIKFDVLKPPEMEPA